MRSILSLTTAAIVFTLPVLASAEPDVQGQHRPDLNAFVNHKITDTQSLLAEVKNNPEVADRYERHFAMSRQELLDFLSTLHLEPLANTAEFTVYSVPPDGVVRMHREVYKKGTPFFVDSTGNPTLVVKCGNPVILGHPRTVKARLSPLPVTTTDLAAFLPDVRDAAVDMPDLLDAEPVIPEVAPDVLVGPAEPIAKTSVPLIGNVRSALPYLGLAPLLAPIFGSSGGNGGNSILFPTPEPAPFMALGLGALALLRRRHRKA